MIDTSRFWALAQEKLSPEDAQAMQNVKTVKAASSPVRSGNMAILYGGSGNPENAVELAVCPDINGALSVGHLKCNVVL